MWAKNPHRKMNKTDSTLVEVELYWKDLDETDRIWVERKGLDDSQIVRMMDRMLDSDEVALVE